MGTAKKDQARSTSRDAEPNGQHPDSKYNRFDRFAKGLVNVPKKEIDEQAKKWDTRKDRPKRAKKAG